jgi:hypothetical protein
MRQRLGLNKGQLIVVAPLALRTRRCKTEKKTNGRPEEQMAIDNPSSNLNQGIHPF